MTPYRDQHYEATVHRGMFNARWLGRELNNRWTSGWRLDRMMELHGDTVLVWERRADAMEPAAPHAAVQPAAAPPLPAARPTAEAPSARYPLRGHLPSGSLRRPS